MHFVKMINSMKCRQTVQLWTTLEIGYIFCQKVGCSKVVSLDGGMNKRLLKKVSFYYYKTWKCERQNT